MYVKVKKYENCSQVIMENTNCIKKEITCVRNLQICPVSLYFLYFFYSHCTNLPPHPQKANTMTDDRQLRLNHIRIVYLKINIYKKNRT